MVYCWFIHEQLANPIQIHCHLDTHIQKNFSEYEVTNWLSRKCVSIFVCSGCCMFRLKWCTCMCMWDKIHGVAISIFLSYYMCYFTENINNVIMETCCFCRTGNSMANGLKVGLWLTHCPQGKVTRLIGITVLVGDRTIIFFFTFNDQYLISTVNASRCVPYAIIGQAMTWCCQEGISKCIFLKKILILII